MSQQQTLTLGGGLTVLEVQDRYHYVPGENLPEPGSTLDLVFEYFEDEKRKQWQCSVNVPDGKTIYVVDRASKVQPTEDQTKWRVRIKSIPHDVPDKADPTRYFRLAIVEPVEPVISNKARKRLEKAGKLVGSVIDSRPEQPASKKPNRVLYAVTFNWNKLTKTWSRNFQRDDGVTEMFYLVDAPEQLRTVTYKHLGVTTSSVPIDVEVIRKIDSEADKVLKFEVRVRVIEH